MTHHRHGPSVKFRKARDNGLVISITAVAVELHKIREQQANEIQGVGTLCVPRDLRALPGTEVIVKLASQLGHLLTQPLQLGIRAAGPGKLAQLFNVALEPV